MQRDGQGLEQQRATTATNRKRRKRSGDVVTYNPEQEDDEEGGGGCERCPEEGVRPELEGAEQAQEHAAQQRVQRNEVQHLARCDNAIMRSGGKQGAMDNGGWDSR